MRTEKRKLRTEKRLLETHEVFEVDETEGRPALSVDGVKICPHLENDIVIFGKHVIMYRDDFYKIWADAKAYAEQNGKNVSLDQSLDKQK